MIDRIFDPSLILPDQYGISATTTLTTDTTPDAARISGVSRVMIESQGVSPELQGALLRLHSQLPPSSIAIHKSISEAVMTTSGVISPASGSPLTNVLSISQSTTEAQFMSTEWV